MEIKSPCPSCSTPNPFPFEDPGSCTVCSGCRSVYSPSEPLVLRKNLLKEVKVQFLLPLGTKLRWQKETYDIRGYVIKQEKNDSTAIWVEYFLTHDALPNLYLSYFNGHWTVIEFLPDINRKKGSIKNLYSMSYKKVEYDYQHKYGVDILDAQGCFNFPFYEDDDNKVREYVNGDEVLIVEENAKDEQLRFYKGRYVYKNELKNLLEPRTDLPKRIGYVAHQPFYFPLYTRSFHYMSVLLIALMLLGMIAWDTFFEPIQVRNGDMTITTESPETFTSQPFTITYDRSILNVTASVSSMENDWVYSEMALINTKTGEERYFEMEAEYYSGYEGGEHWSEGSHIESGNIQYVDAGTYVLEVTPTQQIGSAGKLIRFTLISQKGSWSVFWVLTGVIVITNILLAIIGDYFNHKKRGEEYDTFKSSE